MLNFDFLSFEKLSEHEKKLGFLFEKKFSADGFLQPTAGLQTKTFQTPTFRFKTNEIEITISCTTQYDRYVFAIHTDDGVCLRNLK